MKKHTEDFRQEAVRIALTSGLSQRRVAADLGIGLSTLGKWKVSQNQPARNRHGVERGLRDDGHHDLADLVGSK